MAETDIAALNKTLKDVAQSLNKITRIMEAMNINLMALYEKFSEGAKEVVQSDPTGYDIFLKALDFTQHAS